MVISREYHMYMATSENLLYKYSLASGESTVNTGNVNVNFTIECHC
jgi:hypothetical protein